MTIPDAAAAATAHHEENDETTPLYSKLQEMERLLDDDPGNNNNYSSAYTLCGFCCSWLVWISLWILLFATIIHHTTSRDDDDDDDNDQPEGPPGSVVAVGPPGTIADPPLPKEGEPPSCCWTFLESIYYASVTFWMVGYGDYTVSTNTERLLTCGFMMLSLCFMGLALGRWGNNVIEAYKSASIVHSTNKRRQNQRQQQQDQEFTIFPSLPWLLVQSLFLTALSIFWVFAIQYYEQDEDNDEWTAISTIYFAISTATTVGYGDVVPQKREGKILCIFFLPLAVGTSLHWLVWVAQRGIQRIQRNMVHRSDLSNLRLDEFYERKLQSMGLVDASTFATLKKEYEQLS